MRASRPLHSRMSSAAGFTLIELMVTLTIAALLLTLALPSFRDSIRSNRIATTTNQLIASIALARSEAIRTTHGASLCASDDGVDCGGDWADGVLVWADRDDDSVVDTGEAVRYVQLGQGLALTADVTTVEFNGRGTVAAGATPTFTLQPESGDCPASRMLVTTLGMNASGQVKTSKSACP